MRAQTYKLRAPLKLIVAMAPLTDEAWADPPVYDWYKGDSEMQTILNPLNGLTEDINCVHAPAGEYCIKGELSSTVRGG
jgi:hypothetical protein